MDFFIESPRARVRSWGGEAGGALYRVVDFFDKATARSSLLYILDSLFR